MNQAVSAYEFAAQSEEDTIALAKRLAEWEQPGVVIALDGDLGAGKTRFSQAFAEAIGVAGIVNSPTFTIIKEYQGAQHPFYHMDVYRISLPEADELGLDEYFYGEGVTIVEWAGLIREILPSERLEIYIENLGGQKRKFRLTPFGQPYKSWCSDLQRIGVLT